MTRDRTVPCDGCTACCSGPGRRGAPLEPDDDAGAYRTQTVDGVVMLAHGVDGTCYYLQGGDCAIYDARPNVCRRFDCRDYADHYMPTVKLAAQMRAAA